MLNFTRGGAGARNAAAVFAAFAVLRMLSPVTIMGASAQRGGPQIGNSSADLHFDVVSIKPTNVSRPTDDSEDLIWGTEALPGGLRYRYVVPARALIRGAYKVRGYQIEGAPAWVSSARYSIHAIAPRVATSDEMRSMIKSLLADRFKLSFRRETRMLPVVELVPSKGGLKFVAMMEGDCIPMDSPDAPREPVLPPAPMPKVCGRGDGGSSAAKRHSSSGSTLWDFRYRSSSICCQRSSAGPSSIAPGSHRSSVSASTSIPVSCRPTPVRLRAIRKPLAAVCPRRSSAMPSRSDWAWN